MAGANAVLKSAIGRTRSGSHTSSTVGTNTATIRQSNQDRVHGLADASGPNTHMVSGGTSGIPQFPNSKDRGRTVSSLK